MDRPRILIVDDDSYTCAALHTLFSRQGWLVATASTVSEALAQLEPEPACMLLDLNLPDGRGESVLREVRARSLRTRVVVCSATDDPRRLAAVRGLNPELMLWKPIELAPVFQLCASARAHSA
jgi:DNA-binding response OmpR family regulator